jgi:hypothetical protein
MTETNATEVTMGDEEKMKEQSSRAERYVTIRRDLWRALLKIAGQQIDPDTVEVEWNYALTLDPYGVNPDLPAELQQVGREYFARAPGTAVWVSFDDLPDETLRRLRARRSRNQERTIVADSSEVCPSWVPPAWDKRH